MTNFKEARLDESWDLSPRVKGLRLTVLGDQSFSFLAGQWVNFHLPISVQNPQRSYSIASPPNGSRHFELAVTLVENGPGSTFLHQAPVGTVLKFEGPAGRFVLRQPEKTGAAFIATGTGFTPFRSMLPPLLERAGAAEILLIFGVRTQDEILYRAELESLAERHPNFRFIPTLSRPDVGWSGHTGYVQTHLEKYLKGRSNLEVYVCGLKKMVDDVRTQLMNMGFERKRIYFEKYD